MSQPKRPRDPTAAIASTSNEQVRFVKSLYQTNTRRRERLFAVEGVRLLEEALTAGARPELVLVAPEQLSRTPRGAALLERVSSYRCLNVSEPLLKSISDTVTPQGIIAVFPIPAPPENLQLGPIALILDHVRDPGNAGTLLRSADASGIVRAVAFVDSVDAYSPKVVRAGMGAHFHLTILEDVRWPWLQAHLGSRPVLLADAQGDATYDQVDWTRDCALILGGEAEGAGPDAGSRASQKVKIPMAGPAESLNAAMAGTILLFEAARERREKESPAIERAATAERTAPPSAGEVTPAVSPRATPSETRPTRPTRDTPKPAPPRGRAPGSSEAPRGRAPGSSETPRGRAPGSSEGPRSRAPGSFETPRRPGRPPRDATTRPRGNRPPGPTSGGDEGKPKAGPSSFRPPNRPRPGGGSKDDPPSNRPRRRPKL